MTADPIYNGDIARRLWEWKGITPRKGRTGGWKVTRPDLTTRAGFQWPSKGKVTSSGPWTKFDPCPAAPGDGLCVAVTFSGASSGGIPANGTGLLVEYADAFVLGRDESKVRVRECWVRAVIDVPRAFREGYLYRSNLYGSNLSRSNLSGSNLSGSVLYGSDLSGSVLSRSNLSGSDLSRSDLSGSDLSRSNLSGSDLSRSNLSGSVADKWTRWPEGFDPVARGVIVR